MSRNITSFPIPTRDITASDVPFSSEDLESTNVNDAIEEVNDRFDDYRTITSQDIIDNAQSTSITNLQTAVQMNINVWDEMWENCYWDEGNGGVKVSHPNSFGCASHIKVKPSTTYYFKSPSLASYWFVLFYGSSKNYLNNAHTFADTTFTTPSNCEYITFYNLGNYGTTYNHDISINYPSSFTGYYPSALPKEIAERKDEDFMLAMDGFISPTINGIKNYWDGSLYHRRIARVDLGSLNWIESGTTSVFKSIVSGMKSAPSGDVAGNLYCLSLSTQPSNVVAQRQVNNSIGINADGDNLWAYSSSYSTAQSFKQAMSGRFVYYELATEQTLNIDANGLRFELLWTNASPSSDFGSQTISLDLSGYNYVYVVFVHQNESTSIAGGDSCVSIIMCKNQKYSPSYCAYEDLLNKMFVCSRKTVVTSSSIIFDNLRYAYFGSDGSSIGISNGYVIPYKIYGIR